MIEMNQFILGDCMDLMKQMPDKFIDLCIVDPPYGIGERLSQGAGKLKNSALQNMNSEWDILPDKKYFNELFRISKNQIIWGGNYFDLPPTRGIICWDKKQYMPTFSRWEMAWTSFDCPAKMYEKIGTEIRIHPTQKPIVLYRWLLQHYAKPGDKIFDSHVGSASSLIACLEEGFEYVGTELDFDYWKAATERIEIFKSQGKLF
jgi:site-specific DNA-methyltransferase (adenine-specific)